MLGSEQIRCICNNQTPDGMFNIPCSQCGHYVHGICYQIKKGPITCTECLGEVRGTSSDPNFELDCLLKRLSFSLSQGEHNYFFGDDRSNSVPSIFLELKYNITADLARQVLDISIENKILLLLSDGLLEYNALLDGDRIEADKGFEDLNISQLKHEAQENGNSLDRKEGVKTEPDFVSSSLPFLEADSTNDDASDQVESRNFVVPEIKLEASDGSFDMLTKDELETDDLDIDDYDDKSDSLTFSAEDNKEPKKAKPVACDECDFVATVPSRLRRHKSTVHAKKVHKCLQCDFETVKRSEMRKHMKTAHDAVTHKCKECDSLFKSYSCLSQHMKSVHQGVRYKCTQCIKSYSQPKLLHDHVKHVHEGVVYICDQCSRPCSCKRKLNEHKRRRHPEIYASQIKSDVKEEKDKYKCDQCGALLKSRDTLRSHIKIIHEGQRYYCDQCDKDYSQPALLKAHIKTVHEGIMYKCDQCPYQIAWKYMLTKHIKSKHEGVRYPCELCSYQAPTKRGLNRHNKAIHSGIRYPCDICSYTASSPSGVKQHKEVKHEGKVYPCNQCNYSSPFKHRTNQHILTQHEGVRYTCDLCSYKTAHSGEVLKHKRKAHKELFLKEGFPVPQQ